MKPPFIFPSELEFLEFFESEPILRKPTDSGWVYHYIDDREIRLVFSLNPYERCVQTMLMASGKPLMKVGHENAEFMNIINDVLTCDFTINVTRTKLLIKLSPQITIEWSNLVIAEDAGSGSLTARRGKLFGNGPGLSIRSQAEQDANMPAIETPPAT